MKRKGISLVSAVLCVSLAGCGTSGARVPQEEYDALQSQYESLQAEYDDLQNDYNSVASELDAANEQIEALLSTADKAGGSGGEDAAPVEIPQSLSEVNYTNCARDSFGRHCGEVFFCFKPYFSF